jgi:subtilisin family serine protease
MRGIQALLLAIVFLIADMSALTSAMATQESQVGEEFDEEMADRMPFRGDKHATEEYGWWFTYGPDLNFDGMDDRLEQVIAGEESRSTTAIIGADGKKTVAIVVDYAWHPGQEEVDELTTLLQRHGWKSEGSWFQVMDSIDSIVVDHVPVSALLEIHAIESVVVVEMQNVMYPSLESANPATRIQPSDVYAGTVYDRGYDGEGIVIAVLDSGVDNEHRSLNDFDDEDDEPDLDPNSYSDQKWVAGYDATSQASNPDGSQDPDDGQGHGTHVAGIALGTGDSSRVHIGAAPGSFLVDIKVLTDSGGTNSQNSLNGIQWMINNVDTDWGNGARGIQIGQMSFGSIGNPIQQDSGDNGTGAEARLVNNATYDAGIACIIAAGNDGIQRIASPGSADGAITIGSADNSDSINRTDDFMASYSNSGPRESDNDDDEWDELKPDLVAFGSGIYSASAATGTSFPGSPRPEADSSYESKDGTSMATPLVSGVVALMLQADSGLTPIEIKDILRNSSEQKGNPSEPSVSNRWNSDWGFGSLDASCAVDTVLGRTCTPLTDGGGGGGVIVDPPNESDEGIIFDTPTNGTWLLTGDMMNVEGRIIADTGPWNSVQVKLTQYYEEDDEEVLMDWQEASVQNLSWSFSDLVPDSWYDIDETAVVIEVQALGNGDMVSNAAHWVRIGKLSASFGSPSSGSTLSDTVSFSGTAQGIEPSELIFRVDSEEWNTAYTFDEEDNEAQDWSFTWDSTTVDDGSHKISIRVVNKSGIESDIVRRTFTVDNLPAAPELTFQGSVEVYDQDLPASKAIAGTILEIRFNVVNSGDLDATDLHLKLNAPGSDSSTYPSEGKIPRLEQGETVSVILWWWATEAGLHDVSIQIDPNGAMNDDQSDNEYTFQFEIEERPLEPTLRFLTGAVTTDKPIPLPSDSESKNSYKINVRIDNLGRTDATDIRMILYTKTEGWVETGSNNLLVIPGSDISSGNRISEFSYTHDSIGLVQHKVVLEGDGVELEHSELFFSVVVDEYSVGSKTGLTLSDGEAVLGFAGIPEGVDSEAGGGLLFTTKDGELHARTVSTRFGMPGDTLIEENWAGEFAFTLRDDNRIHLAWTKRTVNQQGYTLTDIGMASIGMSGEKSTTSSHMTPLKLSEGSYWGLDLSSKDDEIVLAGYHRDIVTGGSWNDLTNVFMLYNDDYKTSSWTMKTNVLNDIDIKPQDGDALAVAIGVEEIHLLYQAMRDDVTGIERVGLFYAHGTISQTPFTFQAPAGDDASMPELMAIEDDDEDILLAAWIEGSGRSAEIVSVVQDTIWSVDDYTITPSPGATKVVMIEMDDDEIKIFHDEIGVSGPVTRYGIYNLGDSELSLSNIIGGGHVVGAGSVGDDGIVIMTTPSGQITGKTIASINPNKDTDDDGAFLELLLSQLPGESQQEKMMALGAIGSVLFLMFVAVIVVLRRSHREEEELEVSTKTGDLELLIETESDDEPLFAIDTDGESELVVSTAPLNVIIEEEVEEQTLSDELQAKVEAGNASKRLERRMKRKTDREAKEIFESLSKGLQNLPAPGELPPLPIAQEQEGKQEIPLPKLGDLPPPPAPGELPLPMPPAPGMLPILPGMPVPEKTVSCKACGANITVKDMTLRRMNCPVCSEVIIM